MRDEISQNASGFLFPELVIMQTAGKQCLECICVVLHACVGSGLGNQLFVVGAAITLARPAHRIAVLPAGGKSRVNAYDDVWHRLRVAPVVPLRKGRSLLPPCVCQ